MTFALLALNSCGPRTRIESNDSRESLSASDSRIIAACCAEEKTKPRAPLPLKESRSSGRDSLLWVGCGITRKAFMSRLAAAFEAKSGTHIEIQGGGATRGIRDVAAGRADLGGSCRPRIAHPAETGAVLHPVAWDALVVIVHKSNRLKDITHEQLRSILEGRITNWSELGGADRRISVLVRKGYNSGVGRMLRILLFHDASARFLGATRSFRSSGGLEKALEKDPGGIAVTGISSARKRSLSILRLDGAIPGAEEIISGRYPLVRPLYLVSARHPSRKVRQFIAFAQGEGQRVIALEGCASLAAGQTLWRQYRSSLRAAQMSIGK